MATIHKKLHRQRRQVRIRARLSGTTERPRVAVFKSNTAISAQVIDDTLHKTLASVTDRGMKAPAKSEYAGKVALAFAAGQALAEELKTKKIAAVLFDRGGFKYHGRVKALADGLRAGGISL